MRPPRSPSAFGAPFAARAWLPHVIPYPPYLRSAAGAIDT